VAALRVFWNYLVSTSASLTIPYSPYSLASITLPPAALAAIRPQLCSSMLLVKTVHWGLDRSDARPRFNSSIPLLANLTSLEFATQCNGSLRQVRLTHAPQIDWIKLL
jgi:hypothetical protein